jgi:hypothetical protein
VQEFIKEAKSSDIRAIVVDGKVVGAMKRVVKEGEFEGKDTIRVDCTEVAGKKRLSFTGLATAEPVAVAPAEGSTS